MGRLHKLDAGVELEIIHNHQSQHSLAALSCGYPNGLIYDGYGKEYYFGKSTTHTTQFAFPIHTPTPSAMNSIIQPHLGGKHKEMCAESDDPFMRPPLWEDITSSIQNIDPENAIMLGSIATQVKLETSSSTEDVHMLEPLSSPLLSPLEIKTEKSATTTATLISNQTMTTINHLQPPPPLQHLQHSSQLQLHHMASNAGETAYHHHANGSYQPAHHILNGFLGGTNGSGLHQYSQHQQPQPGTMSSGDNSSYYGSPVAWSGHAQVKVITNKILTFV